MIKVSQMEHEYKVGDVIYRKGDNEKIGYVIKGIDSYTYKGFTLYIVCTGNGTLRWFGCEIGGLVRTKEENERQIARDDYIILIALSIFWLFVMIIVMGGE